MSSASSSSSFGYNDALILPRPPSRRWVKFEEEKVGKQQHVVRSASVGNLSGRKKKLVLPAASEATPPSKLDFSQSLGSDGDQQDKYTDAFAPLRNSKSTSTGWSSRVKHGNPHLMGWSVELMTYSDDEIHRVNPAGEDDLHHDHDHDHDQQQQQQHKQQQQRTPEEPWYRSWNKSPSRSFVRNFP